METLMDEPLIPPKIPQPLAAGDAPIPNLGLPSWPIKYWVKRFLACNPFYLVSAALLLYGFYRVSVDADFLRGELAQLGKGRFVRMILLKNPPATF
jgi:hypothetical protein